MRIDFDIIFLISALLIGSAIVLDIVLVVKLIRRLANKSQATKISLDSAEASTFRDLTTKKTFLSRITDTLWKLKFVIINVVFISVGVILVYASLQPLPVIQSAYPAKDENWNTYSKPIEIRFNEPVEIAKLKPFLSVENLQGEWRYEKYLGILPVTRVARFYPHTTLLPNQRVVVYMTGVARLGVNENHEHSHNFFSQKEPEIASTYPLNAAEEVDVNSPITLNLTSENEPYNQWEFEIEPEIEFQVDTPNTKTFVLRPTKPLAQSQTYQVKVYRTAITYNTLSGQELTRDNKLTIHELSFASLKAPLVKRFTPSGTGVRENTPIEIVFDLPMQQESVLEAWQITPAVQGTFEWTSNTTLLFTPSMPLPKETEYTVRFPAGLKSLTGGTSETEISYSFTTIGAVRVSAFSPENGTQRVARNSVIQITFDQEVDHNSAESKISISPGTPGSFSWEGNKMIYTPASALAFSTTYQVSLGAGIKSVYGLDSREEFKTSFNTVPNQTILSGFNIDLQDHNFTCGVAAAKMILAWKGYGASEETIISYMGQDTSSYNCGGAGCNWGDPNRNYLGYTDGSGNLSGTNNYPAYGVHWLPIQNMFKNYYGINTTLHYNWNVVSMAHAIAAGHPVQIWWYNGVSGGQSLQWTDVGTGQTIHAINGMHSVVVYGFYGDVDNPTNFAVMDPWWGAQTYSRAKFDWQWPYLGNMGLEIL
jgi:hypothetical protein